MTTPHKEIKFRIWSNEHVAWWKPFGTGYTEIMAEAGIYTKEEARAIVTNSSYGGHFRSSKFLVPHETMVPIE